MISLKVLKPLLVTPAILLLAGCVSIGGDAEVFHSEFLQAAFDRHGRIQRRHTVQIRSCGSGGG